MGSDYSNLILLKPAKTLRARLDVVVKHELTLFRTGRKRYLLAFELYIGVYKFIAKVWFEIALITF